jgi:hypothetical protein
LTFPNACEREIMLGRLKGQVLASLPAVPARNVWRQGDVAGEKTWGAWLARDLAFFVCRNGQSALEGQTSPFAADPSP